VSSAMSAAELVVMAAVICVSLGVMVALPFLAERQPDRRRPLSGKQRRRSHRPDVDQASDRAGIRAAKRAGDRPPPEP